MAIDGYSLASYSFAIVWTFPDLKLQLFEEEEILNVSNNLLNYNNGTAGCVYTKFRILCYGYINGFYNVLNIWIWGKRSCLWQNGIRL